MTIILDGQKKEAFFRDDYTYFEETNSFYKIHTIPRSWVNAKKRCLLEGATLFFPELSLEADVALGHLNDTLSTLPSIYLGIASVLTKGVFITVNGEDVLFKYFYMYEMKKHVIVH